MSRVTEWAIWQLTLESSIFAGFLDKAINQTVLVPYPPRGGVHNAANPAHVASHHASARQLGETGPSSRDMTGMA